jgi:tripartite-type tricarboxylate transporter receptor subunit TctC
MKESSFMKPAIIGSLSIKGAAVAALFAACGAASAQDAYPSKPIKLIVPYAAGGPTDIVARTVGMKLTERIGQQLVIDNRGGANGIIGMELAAKAPADGYNLVMGGAGVLGSNPAFYSKLPYDAVKDFAPISLLTQAPLLLVVNPSLGVKTFPEFIKLAKSKPGELSFGSGGTGGVAHLAGELLNYVAGVKTVHVPYKGAAPAMSDLLGGQIGFTFTSTVASMPNVKSGKLIGLGVTWSKRAQALPDIPSISETYPGYEVRVWYGFLAPAKTPRPIIDKLNKELDVVVQNPEVTKRFIADGGEAVGGSPEVFAKVIAQEIAIWTKLSKDTGLKLE